MGLYEQDHPFQKGVGNSRLYNGSMLPTQTLPSNKKTEKWKRANMDALEIIGQRQFMENLKFRDFYKMVQGKFTYAGTGFGDFQEMPWFDEKVRALREDEGIPTYIKHYDFIGIIVNVLVGIYTDFQDVFRVDSKDEYSTNEYIREKTELLQNYASQTFQQELQKLLIMRGIDPAKDDFQSQEEYDAFQQEVEQQKKALTPDEIDSFMQKNFKVVATEWAQNTLEEDKQRFSLAGMDKDEFIDRLLTGRWFRHYRIGFDYYKPERWKPEEVFFSEDVDAQYPQDGEYVGRVHFYSPSDIINLYGHLLTAKEQEEISKGWNQNDDFTGGGNSVNSILNKGLSETHIVPHKDHYTHDLLTRYEDALNTPLGVRTLTNKDGQEYQVNDWLPTYGNDSFLGSKIAQYQRDDITVRTDLLQVTEAYWRSYKRIGLLTYENEQGIITQTLTTDDLLKEFLTENEISQVKDTSYEEVLRAKEENNLYDYVNTIVYSYVPQIWKGIKVKNTGGNLKKDLYLDVRPLDFQIKGAGDSDSELYNFKLPVAGYIGSSIATKLAPYQVLHNICMNQITDILEKEIGIFFLMDINYLPSEYKEGGNHEDALLTLRDIAKDIGFLPVDMSKQNTAGNQAVNSFQKQDLTYGTQVQYRWQLAMQYKQEALQQIGITPQLLGQPNNYTTAEGVKQGAQASYAQITPIFEEQNLAKAKAMEVHLAVAQWCQANNRDTTVIQRKGDGAHYFLDIMAEDGELFPLRKLGIIPTTDGKDRKVLEQLKSFMMQDNTIARDFKDVIDLMTNPTVVELKQLAAESRKRTQKETEEQRQFESSQLDKQLESQKVEADTERAHEKELETIRGTFKMEAQKLDAMGRIDPSEGTQYDTYDRITEAAQDAKNNNFKQAELQIKQENITNKDNQESKKLGVKLDELALRARELDLKEKAINASKFNSIVNKN